MTDFTKYTESLRSMIDSTNNISILEKNAITIESSKKLKLLMVSHHISCPTKNAKFSLNILEQFSECKDWLEIVHYAIHPIHSSTRHVSGRTYPSKIKVIDTLEVDNNDPHGYANLCSIITKETPNILFFYDDMVHIIRYIEFIKTKEIERFFRIWGFIDTCSIFQSQPIIETINREMDIVFTYSNEWKQCIKSSGVIRPIHDIHFNINKNNIRKIPKEYSRKCINLPTDAFIFIGNGTNCEKNRIDIIITSFVKLIEKYPSKLILLLLCCDKGDNGGFPIFEIYRHELKRSHLSAEIFGTRMIVASNSNKSFTDEEINFFYNSADIGLNCTEGSSFNLTAFEQMGLGIPQIASDILAHSDFCASSNSSLIQPTIKLYNCTSQNIISGDKYIINSNDVFKMMEQYLLHEDIRSLHGSESMKTIQSYRPNGFSKFIDELSRLYKDLYN